MAVLLVIALLRLVAINDDLLRTAVGNDLSGNRSALDIITDLETFVRNRKNILKCDILTNLETKLTSFLKNSQDTAPNPNIRTYLPLFAAY